MILTEQEATMMIISTFTSIIAILTLVYIKVSE